MKIDDLELLQAYVECNSEQAFEIIVCRYTNLVYSAAFRCLGNPHYAEEVTQAVFIILAKKAGRLSKGTVLSGWLYQTARLTAANYLRSEIHRQRREQEAYMQSLVPVEEPDADVWNRVAPLLETAMGQLAEKDRNTIVLRFMEGKSIRDVARVLGVNEGAAKKRVTRAAEKLRHKLLRRGVSVSTAVLVGSISVNAVQAAPAGLASSSAALGFLKGKAASSSILAVMNETFKIMAWAKLQSGALISLAVLLAGSATFVVANKIIPSRQPVWQLNSYFLEREPLMLQIRPTRFSDDPGKHYSGGKSIGRIQPLKSIIATAYGVNTVRIMAPDDLPSGNYDFIDTLPNDPYQALQAELRKQFHLAAHRETHSVDALELRVKDPNFPRLTVNESTNEITRGVVSELKMRARPLADLANYLEKWLDQPVVDRTGLTNRFDLDLNWPLPRINSTPQAIRLDLEAAILNLGLELIPARTEVEMLVVDRLQK